MEENCLKTLLESTTYRTSEDSRLTVLAEFKDSEVRSRNRMVFCVCDCGNFVYTSKSKVQLSTTRSCGCLNHQKFIDLGNMRRLDSNNTAINQVLHRYVHGASSRGLSYNLSREQFIDITSSPCHYCGVLPYRVSYPRNSKAPPYVYNGIDRQDNNRGYELDNVVPCCYTCNAIKLDLSIDAMYDHMNRILRNIEHASKI